MLFYFDEKIAKKSSVNAALVYEYIFNNCEFNYFKNSKTFIHDNKVWMRTSMEQMQQDLCVISIKQIRTAIELLVKNDLILVGNFNEDKRDQTKWYTVQDRSRA